jgi:hypothetical protein
MPEFGPAGPSGWHSLTQKYTIQSIPTMYLIDRNGVLRSVTARQRLEKMIQQLQTENNNDLATFQDYLTRTGRAPVKDVWAHPEKSHL